MHAERLSCFAVYTIREYELSLLLEVEEFWPLSVIVRNSFSLTYMMIQKCTFSTI